MAKVIYIDDNGNSEILRDGDISKWDVLFRDDYFATKLWTPNDIAMRIEDLYEREATDEEIADVITAGGGWWGLIDCTDGEWYCIDDVIVEVLGRPEED